LGPELFQILDQTGVARDRERIPFLRRIKRNESLAYIAASPHGGFEAFHGRLLLRGHLCFGIHGKRVESKDRIRGLIPEESADRMDGLRERIRVSSLHRTAVPRGLRERWRGRLSRDQESKGDESGRNPAHTAARNCTPYAVS